MRLLVDVSWHHNPRTCDGGILSAGPVRQLSQDSPLTSVGVIAVEVVTGVIVHYQQVSLSCK